MYEEKHKPIRVLSTTIESSGTASPTLFRWCGGADGQADRDEPSVDRRSVADGLGKRSRLSGTPLLGLTADANPEVRPLLATSPVDQEDAGTPLRKTDTARKPAGALEFQGSPADDRGIHRVSRQPAVSKTNGNVGTAPGYCQRRDQVLTWREERIRITFDERFWRIATFRSREIELGARSF
jgi:hypothetical protein